MKLRRGRGDTHTTLSLNNHNASSGATSLYLRRNKKRSAQDPILERDLPTSILVAGPHFDFLLLRPQEIICFEVRDEVRFVNEVGKRKEKQI